MPDTTVQAVSVLADDRFVPVPWATDMAKLAVSSPVLIPSVHIVMETEGTYDCVVDSFAPNSCYIEDGYELGMPPGVSISIPEYAHLVCRAKYTGNLNRMCLLYLKPLRWSCQDISLGAGKSHLVVHIAVGDVLAGSMVVKLPTGGNR